MLLGEYEHNLDYKGRISVPKKFRKDLASGAVLTKGLDGCLFLYPVAEWSALSEKVRNLPLTAADARSFARYLFAGAVAANFDNLGRIGIPDYLRKYARLEKEVVIIGVLERIEIWSRQRWKKTSKQLEKAGEEIAESLKERGI